MKILYLTNESYYKNPIIDSQVISLVEEMKSIESNISMSVVTFDKEEDILHNKNNINNTSFKLDIIKDRGHLLNIIYLMVYPLFVKNVDIVHVRSFPAMFGAIIKKMFSKAKIVFDPRGLFAEELSYDADNQFLTKIFKIFEKYFCKYSDSIIVVSEPFKTYYKDLYKIKDEKIHVISTFSQKNDHKNNNEISILDLKKDYFKSTEVSVFVYSGSFEEWQLVEKVFDFFEIAGKKMQNARFAIFSKEIDKFRECINNRGLDASKFFLKSLTKKELNYYLGQGDFGLLFRDNNIINKVSAPIKVKDYLISGLALIMTNSVGDSSDFVREKNAGLIIDDTSQKEYERILDYITNNIVYDKSYLKNLAEEFFGVRVAARATFNIYKELIPH